jgi:hypothetical protein
MLSRPDGTKSVPRREDRDGLPEGAAFFFVARAFAVRLLEVRPGAVARGALKK